MIVANPERCMDHFLKSQPLLATLVPHIGYHRVAELLLSPKRMQKLGYSKEDALLLGRDSDDKR